METPRHRIFCGFNLCKNFQSQSLMTFNNYSRQCVWPNVTEMPSLFSGWFMCNYNNLQLNPFCWLNKGSESFCYRHKGRIMNHEAGSCYYILKSHAHPLQMESRGPEKTTQRRGMSCRGTSTVWVIPFMSLGDTSLETSLPPLCTPPPTLSPLLTVLPLPPPQCAAGASLFQECWVLPWVSTSLHSSVFYCLDLMISQRSF